MRNSGNIVNYERLNAFPLRKGRRQECRLSPLLFNIVLQVFNQCNKQRIGNKKYTNGKRRNKTVPIWRWSDGLHTNSKGSTKSKTQNKTKTQIKIFKNNKKGTKAIQWSTDILFVKWCWSSYIYKGKKKKVPQYKSQTIYKI